MVRQLFQADALKRCHLFVATLAFVRVVAVEHLALNQTLKALFDVFLLFHLQIHGHKGLLTFAVAGAALADDFVAQDPAEILLDEVLVVRALDEALDPVHEHVEEFVDVHLFEDVGWLSVVVFVGVAEGFWVVGLLVAEVQGLEHAFHLVKDVVLLGLFFKVRVGDV